MLTSVVPHGKAAAAIPGPVHAFIHLLVVLTLSGPHGTCTEQQDRDIFKAFFKSHRIAITTA